MTDLNALKTACTCCDGLAVLTPAEVFNRPGLSELVYRVGTHPLFKQTMLARISTQPALAALTTRDDEDLTIALLDGWATVLDVLTFYTERHAQEGFLRTAVERRSLLELARLIGYELRPGVAASVDLAFTLDGGPGSPAEVVIPAGVRAQSLPGQDELPQPFETMEEITAYAEWSGLRPRRFRPQEFDIGTRVFYLEGNDSGIKVGDWVLLRGDDEGEMAGRPLRVTGMEEMTFGRVEDGDERVLTQVKIGSGKNKKAAKKKFGAMLPLAGKISPGAIQELTQGKTLDAKAILQYELIHGLPFGGFGKLVNAGLPKKAPSGGGGLYAFRVEASVFGHNAPRYLSLPKDWRKKLFGKKAYPNNWDASPVPKVHQDSANKAYTQTYGDNSSFEGDEVVLLERAFDEIEPEGFALLRSAGKNRRIRAFQVVEAEKVSRSDFGVQGKASRIRIVPEPTPTGLVPPALDKFSFRDTTVLAASEALLLGETPIQSDVKGDELELDRALERQILPGHRIALTGERADVAGDVVVSEVRTVIGARLRSGNTVLELDAKLEFSYRRDSLRINANVAPATHGESQAQILGSGEAGSPFQRFALQGQPLTYVPAQTASGGASTLGVRVNGVAWREVPDFYQAGPKERVFATRRRDSGVTEVLFGDGERGARLPSGADNVTAEYRVGVGLDGHVESGRISLLATPTLGVREVANPLASSGGEDPESRDNARRNAPLTVLTLDRVVSLHDFEDFSRAFLGVGKARADWLWDGTTRRVHVTVAGADGKPLPDSSTLPADLRAAIRRHGDPFVPFSVGPFARRLFTVTVHLKTDPDREQEVVWETATTALETAFAFEARDFGRAVHESDLLAVLHDVEGVTAARIEVLAQLPEGGGAPVPVEKGKAGLRIDPRPARLGPLDERGRPTVLGAELLMLAPFSLIVGAMS